MAKNAPLSLNAQSYRVAGAMAVVFSLSLGAAGWLSHHQRQRYQQPRYEPKASFEHARLDLKKHQFKTLTFQLPAHWKPQKKTKAQAMVFIDSDQPPNRLLVRRIELDSPTTLAVAMQTAVKLEINDEDLPTFSTVHLWVKQFGPKSASRLLAISKAPSGHGLTLHHLVIWTVDHQKFWLFYTRLIEPTGHLDTDQTVALDRLYASLALMAQEEKTIR